MPADDITVKEDPAMGMVAIGATAPEWDNQYIVAAVNVSRAQSDELGIREHVKAAGPYQVFYEHGGTRVPRSGSTCR
jgi:hypothetical protein